MAEICITVYELVASEDLDASHVCQCRELVEVPALGFHFGEDLIQSVYPDATHQEIRRELDYLEAREMVAIARDPVDRWFVDLTRTGIEFVEYTIDAQPGVARPRITQG